MKNLTSLTYLDLSYCPKIDTWCMDRITGEYADTLEYLDLSGCKNLQATSLEPIWRLSKLKTLVLRDMVSIKGYFATNTYSDHLIWTGRRMLKLALKFVMFILFFAGLKRRTNCFSRS